MKKFSLIILLLIIVSLAANAQDSLFAAIQNDKLFIPHVILPKQNLYRISRYYSSSVVDIKILNNRKEDTVKVGEIIMIPLVKRNFGIHPNKNKTEVKYQPIYIQANTIKNKRTLLAAVPYESDEFEQFLKRKKIEFSTKNTCLIGYIELRDMALNSLPAKKTEDPPAIVVVEQKIDTTPKIVIKKDTVKSIKIAKSDTIIVSKRPMQLMLLEKLYFKNESLEINEKGTAISFQVDSLGNYQKGFYALHNTLPVGTIIKLVNPMNQNEVLVKVLGKIPEIAGNHRCSIKISHDAALYLDAKDERFLVEMFYH
jgi:hypothetical protein